MTIALSTHVIQSEWVSNNLNDPNVRILDARPSEFYADGHIPNAVSVNMNDFRHESDGVEGMLLAPDEFAVKAGALGIDERTTIVIYDDYHGLLASRLAWSFLRYGHVNVLLLDGGWDEWEFGGYPTSDVSPTIAPRTFTPRLNGSIYADFAYVQAYIHQKNQVLLDVRAENEYAKGHIPSAVLWDWTTATSDNRLFGDLEALRADLAEKGVTPDKDIITYCQSGVRASHTFFLLHQLGFKQIRMYDGSWLEWSGKVGAK
ncbi:MAG: sulfurtransferase [Anaerolineae bacterium]|nr:sulfurtransferase [Anaerolineae bacterium]